MIRENVIPRIIGTAGHIDHGKTALVRLLTGVDTDTLKEEKERGITIKTGFTRLILPDGRVCGVVDVPGHERFVRRMVAGSNGIDIVLLVVAADEGVKPQTVEHLDILSILGIEGGVVAINKIDLVDIETVELATLEVKELLAGTFLHDAPIVPVSAQSGVGKDRLLDAIVDSIGRLGEKEVFGPFILPVDRVFVKKGFGIIVTGTAVSGRVETGDILEVSPQSRLAKVRRIEVYNEERGEAIKGMRTAINLQGLTPDEVKPGDIVATPSTLNISKSLLLFLRNSPRSKPLKNGTNVRFLSGCNDTGGIIHLLEEESLAPDSSCIAWIKLERPIPVYLNEPFIIRRPSPAITIGGGKIIYPSGRPSPKKWVRIDILKEMASGGIEERVKGILSMEGFRGVEKRRILRIMIERKDRLEEAISRLKDEGEIVELPGDGSDVRLLSQERFAYLKSFFLETLKLLHEKNPLSDGFLRAELKEGILRGIDDRLLEEVIASLEREGYIEISLGIIKKKGYFAELNEEERREAEEIKKRLLKGGYSPDPIGNIIEEMNLKQMEKLIPFLVRRGEIVKVNREFYYHPSIIERLKEEMKRFFRERDGGATVSEIKEFLGITRRHAIPLVEFMDREGWTVRNGDLRYLRSEVND